MINSNLPLDIDKEEVSSGSFQALVAESAYYKAEKRDFAAGYDAEDWFEAEQEIHEKCNKEDQKK